VVLTAALLTVGADGPGATVVALVIVAAAVVVTTWTVVRARAHRLAYEARLTAWAAERAARDERLRIARELHDVVSHGLGLIVVRAAAARRSNGDGAAALPDIEKAGRDALTELRRMLTVLRGNDVLLRPAPSLADLPEVLAAARSAGLDVVCEADELGEVSPGVQAAAVAVVREAVANTLRHAGPTAVRVELRRDGAAVVVTVEDDGPRGHWQPTPGAGHGLAGLRERVTALGGRLETAGGAGNGPVAGPEKAGGAGNGPVARLEKAGGAGNGSVAGLETAAGTGFRLVARLPDGGRA